MSEHIKLDELMILLCGSRMTRDKIPVFSRVLTHIGQCKQCEEVYKRALEVADAIAGLPEQVAKDMIEKLITGESSPKKTNDTPIARRIRDKLRSAFNSISDDFSAGALDGMRTYAFPSYLASHAKSDGMAKNQACQFQKNGKDMSSIIKCDETETIDYRIIRFLDDGKDNKRV